jgi:hypothetical protein
MSIFNTNAAREDECFCVGVKCRNQPVADGKPAVIFFYLFCLHLKIRISTIRLVSDKWVCRKPRSIFDTGGRTHASAALWHIESVNKARHVFVAPDMDVLNKKVRSKGEQK